MRTTRQHFVISVITIFIAFLFSGCSIIGYNIGKAVDNNHPDFNLDNAPGFNVVCTSTHFQDAINYRELNDQNVYVCLKDNQLLFGKFISAEEGDVGKFLIIENNHESQKIAFQEILCLQTEEERSEIRKKNLIVTPFQGNRIVGKFHSVFMESSQVYLVLENRGINRRLLVWISPAFNLKTSNKAQKTGLLLGW